MFPERRKSAQVKKEAQILQMLGHHCTEADGDLLKLALQKTKKRVVVKRPLLAASLTQQKPSFAVKGKTVRFDVYYL